MTALSTLLQKLAPCVLDAPAEAGAALCPEQIELLEDQAVLRSGVLYLGGASAESLLRQAQAEPGTLILLADSAAAPAPQGAVLIRMSCSLPRLFNTVSACLREDPDAEGETLSRFRQCWDDILERRLTGADEVRQALSGQRYPISNFVAVAVISCPQEGARFSCMQLLARLRELFPDTNMTSYHGEIVLLYSYADRKFLLRHPQEQALHSLLEEYNAYISISNGTRNLSTLPILYGLARQTLVLGRQIAPDGKTRIFTADEYNIYCVIDLCAQRFMELHRSDDIIYLIHPAVIHLTRYDRRHNTNLRDVLYYYLLNDRNLVKTAADAYMHRNTVINKVNKIQELVQVDLEDGRLRQRLMFSCQVILYYEKVMHLELKL